MPNQGTLKVFGGFRLENAAGETVSFNLRKAEGLIAYLALAPEQISSRENLAAILWGGSEHDRARQSLRQALLAIGKTLEKYGLDILKITNQHVQLEVDSLEIDAAALFDESQCSTRGELENCCNLYVGEILQGLRIESSEFDEWLLSVRQRFHDKAMSAHVALLELLTEAEEIDDAIDVGKAALRIDLFREDIHRKLMHLYLAQGSRAAALSQFQECERVLKAELGTSPDEETRTLAQQIAGHDLEDVEVLGKKRAGRISREIALPRPDNHFLFGRTDAIERLTSSLELAGRGHGNAFVVEGEAGIGKSHVLRFFAQEAELNGWKVLYTACSQINEADNLRTWYELLGAGDSVEAASREADAESGDLNSINSIAEKIAEHAAEKGVLIVIDDFEWAGLRSQRALGPIVNILRHDRVLFLVSTASEGGPSGNTSDLVFRELIHEGLLQRLTLQPLNAEQIQTLLAQQHPNAPWLSELDVLQRMWAICGGNPAIALDLASTVRLRPGAQPGYDLPLPQRAQDALEEKLKTIDSVSVHVASLASVMVGRTFYNALKLAVQLSDVELTAALEDLAAAKIVVVENDIVSFVLERERMALELRLLPSRKKIYHAQFAEALSSDELPIRERSYGAAAKHFKLAGDIEHAMANWILQARYDFAQGAVANAKLHYELALEAVRADEMHESRSETKVDILAGLAEIAEASHEFQLIEPLFDEALAACEQKDDPMRRASLLAGQSRTSMLRGREEKAFGLARQALKEADRVYGDCLWLPAERLLTRFHLVKGGHRTLLARLHDRLSYGNLELSPPEESETRALLGMICAIDQDFTSAYEHCAAAVELADVVPNRATMTACLQIQGLVQTWRQDIESALQSFDAAMKIAVSRGDLLRIYSLSGHRGLAHLVGEDYAGARTDLKTAIEMADRLKTKFLLAFFKTWLAEASVLAGSEDGLQLSREAFQIGAETNQAWPQAVATRAIADALSCSDGSDLRLAERMIRTAIADQTELGLGLELQRSNRVYSRILESQSDQKRS